MSENNVDVNALTQAFANRVGAPQKVTSAAGTVEQYSVADQIKALEYLKKTRQTPTSPLGRAAFIRFKHDGND